MAPGKEAETDRGIELRTAALHERDPSSPSRVFLFVQAGDNQTYYHAKDVAFLHHEPLLAKFREFKVSSFFCCWLASFALVCGLPSFFPSPMLKLS